MASLLDGIANLLLMVAFATEDWPKPRPSPRYPVAMIVLAIKVLRERPSMTQGIRLLLAIPAVFLLRST
ncbi:hypothetical protein [Mesorhizobium sp. M0578]|uniref:hypothetical protein n=1 Tax=unclassified Mesorhizobium TaxID=325217 RepID=UPI00333A0D2E